MEIRQLRSFLAVAETLNFSRAAQSLFLSQSALSRQIMDLEKEVGLSLFERNTRRVELTEAGRLLLTHARELMDRWDHLGAEIRDGTRTQPAATLSLGLDNRAVSHPAQRVALAEQLNLLRRRHPGLRIQIRRQDYRSLSEDLCDRLLDFAVVLDRPLEHRSPVTELFLAEEEMVLVFRSDEPEHPETVADALSRRGLLLVDREPQGMNHIIRILDDLKLEPRIHFCQSADDMSFAMECGESAAIMPRSVTAMLANPHLQVLPLPSEHARLRLSLLWERSQRHPLMTDLKTALQRVFSP